MLFQATSGFGISNVAHDCIQIVAGSDELAQSAPGWRERIEFLDGEAVFGIRAAEVREFPEEFIDNFRANRLVNA